MTDMSVPALASVASAFRTIDRRQLQVSAEVLASVLAEIDLDPKVLSDLPEVDEPRLAGIRSVRELIVQRREQTLAYLAELAHVVPARPDVLDPTRCVAPTTLSRQGQPLVPIITERAATTTGLSSAQVWMPPGHTSLAHTHHHTEVAVLVISGRAITLWWDEDGELHELPQEPGQHLFIPAGVPHAAINPFGVPVVAAEFRNNAVFNADNELLSYLDPQVTARIRAGLAA